MLDHVKGRLLETFKTTITVGQSTKRFCQKKDAKSSRAKPFPYLVAVSGL